jgi:hypothetical protein
MYRFFYAGATFQTACEIKHGKLPKLSNTSPLQQSCFRAQILLLSPFPAEDYPPLTVKEHFVKFFINVIVSYLYRWCKIFLGRMEFCQEKMLPLYFISP